MSPNRIPLQSYHFQPSGNRKRGQSKTTRQLSIGQDVSLPGVWKYGVFGSTEYVYGSEGVWEYVYGSEVFGSTECLEVRSAYTAVKVFGSTEYVYGSEGVWKYGVRIRQ